MSRLTLDRLGKTYAGAAAVSDVSLDVAQGEMIVLLGPSGCGKTTTLRMIAGFTAASSGDIRLDGTSILALPPHRREMGIVFQSYALFPHLSVARNVAFGLEMRGVPAVARRERVAQMLRLDRLEPYADRLPRQLSGGQQQRVALARALAIEPRVLLLDEPLSNLDASLRGEVGRDIRLLQRESNLTTVMVTHDQDEAIAMADRLVVMRDGRVQQIGTQADLYERPATAFVAGFIGRSTMLPCHVDADGTALCDGAPLQLAGRYAATGAATLALRPERLSLGRVTGSGTVTGFIGNMVRMVGWMILFAHGGLIDGIARLLTGHGFELMYTATAVVCGIVSINLPFVVLTIRSTMETIDPRIEEAAESLGATPARRFWRIVWPLALPGTVTAGILCFILAMNAYATPFLLGGPRFQMMAPLLYWEFSTNNNWPFASAIALFLMGTTLFLTAGSGWFIARR